MKKSAIFGWENVFSFTLKQMLKSKSNIVMLVIFFLLSLAAYPLMTAFKSSDNINEITIDKLYIFDETGMELEKWLDINDMGFEGKLPEEVVFTQQKAIVDEQDKDTSKIDLNTDDEKASAYVTISYDENRNFFYIECIYGAKGDVTNSDANRVAGLINSNFKMQLAKYKGIEDSQLEYLSSEVNTDKITYDPDAKDSDKDEDKPLLSAGEYGIVILVVCVVIMLIALSGEQIATIVLQEKASKLVEFLMTSVTPLALLIGKVAAVFVMAVVDIASIVLGFAGSVALTNVLFPGTETSLLETLENAMAVTGESVVAVNVQPFMIPISIIMILLGVLFYSVLAALAGACVSRMEELTESMKIFSLTMIVGAYFTMIVCAMDMMGTTPDSLKIIALYFPLCSVVLAPSYLMIGQLSIVGGFISLGIMILATAFIFWFAARVYETLIYHKGKKLKIKDIIMLGKQKKGVHHEK